MMEPIEWKRRDCPLNIVLDPCPGGWEDVDIDFGDEHQHILVSSCCIGTTTKALIKTLYALYPDHAFYGGEAAWITKDKHYSSPKDCEKSEFHRVERSADHVLISGPSWIPLEAEFLLDGEDDRMLINLKRPLTIDKDFLVAVRIEYSVNEFIEGADRIPHKISTFDVMYSDLCYGVGKALTEAMKKHGFMQYANHVGFDLNVRELLFLKACGMGHPDYFNEYKLDFEEISFEDEMKLLMFDM